MDKYPAHFIQRVLEYGSMDDWRLLRSYYGLPKIVEECKQLRTLDPVCLSYICAISHTNPKEYRCYHTRQSNPTPKMFAKESWDEMKSYIINEVKKIR